MAERIYREFSVGAFFLFSRVMSEHIEVDKNTQLKDISSKEERQRIFAEAKQGKHQDNKHLQAVTKNIIPLNERSEEEAREIRRKGAVAINKLRGERKNAKQILENLLPLYANSNAIRDNDCIPEDIKAEILNKKIDITQYDLIMLAMIHKAQQGDVKSAEYISNHFGDIVTKEVNISESISESDKKLIEKLSNRLNIIE